MKTRICGNCACFRADLSKSNPDFPQQGGCVECTFSMKVPVGRSIKTRTNMIGTIVRLHDPVDDASACEDFIDVTE